MLVVDKLLGLLVLNHFGYWFILFFALLEASPVFGLLIPGQLMVIVGGFFVKLGILDFGDTVFVAAVGAILGDLLGYLLGRKYGYSFIARFGKYFFFKKKYFKKTKKLMNSHVGKTLIIGRFNSLTRSFAPFVAGSSEVSFFKFFIYNIVGGVGWAVLFVTLGYFFGGSYEIVSKYVGKFMLVAVVISILLIYLYTFVNKKKSIFTKYHFYVLILNLFSLYLFSKLVEDVVDGEMITKLDVLVNSMIVVFWNPFLNKVMVFITKIASPSNLFVLSLILFGVLVYKKRWYFSLLFLSGMFGGLLFVALVKLGVHRVRPVNALIEVSGFSFPSGHATMAIIFFSLLLYSFKDDIKNVLLRRVFVISNVVVLLLVGLSRVYLNVHWLSDVIAGFGLGLFWLTLLILVFKIVMSVSTNSLETIGKWLKKRFS